MKIAYFSPMPPLETGVSDYSRELLGELVRRAEVDLWIDQELEGPPPAGCGIFHWREASNLTADLSRYDSVLYHLGNSRHHRAVYQAFLEYPGVVVMHDFVMHHFFVEYYLAFARSPAKYTEEMEYNYGVAGRLHAQDVFAGTGLPPWEIDPLGFPLNKRVLDLAKGVIVHSEFARQLVRQTHPHLPIAKINLFSGGLPTTEGIRELKLRYRLPTDRIIIASVGFATPAKRIDTIFRALKRLKNNQFIFLLVGEINPAVETTVRNAGLGDRIRTTGYLSREAFDDYCRVSDICVNLRYPTTGETSASVCKVLGGGKACIVSDVGWFSELPDDCVAKVDIDESEEDILVGYLDKLMADEALRTRMGANAQKYIQENHSVQTAADQYVEFLHEVIIATRERELDSAIVAEVARHMVGLGATDDDHDFIEAAAHIIARRL